MRGENAHDRPNPCLSANAHAKSCCPTLAIMSRCETGCSARGREKTDNREDLKDDVDEKVWNGVHESHDGGSEGCICKATQNAPAVFYFPVAMILA